MTPRLFRALRRHYGISLQQMADRIGVSPPAVVRLELHYDHAIAEHRWKPVAYELLNRYRREAA